jgi:protein-tyrosine phosphatase
LRSWNFQGKTHHIQSSTLVIAYLMKRKNCGFKEAISFVRQARPNVCPNLGFERQLKEYELFLNKQAEFGF